MDFKSLKVSQLRDELTSLGLDNKGLKAELIQRLEEHAASSSKRKHEDNKVSEGVVVKKAKTEATKDDFVVIEATDVPSVEEANVAAAAQNEVSVNSEADTKSEATNQINSTNTDPAASSTTVTATPGKETGVTKWFNHTKGFGFISRAQGGDIFVHLSSINNKPGFAGLDENEQLEYDVILDDAKRDRASNVSALGGGQVRGVVSQPVPAVSAYGAYPAFSGGAYAAPAAAPAKVLPSHTQGDLAPGRVRGVVKWFNATKGFGFISTLTDPPEEFFVHQSEIQVQESGFRSLANEEKVEFCVEETGKGSGNKRKAVRVTGPGGRDCVGQDRPQQQQQQQQNNYPSYPSYPAYGQQHQPHAYPAYPQQQYQPQGYQQQYQPAAHQANQHNPYASYLG